MLIITIEADVPSGLSLAVKEQIAMELEKWGDIKVVKIKEVER